MSDSYQNFLKKNIDLSPFGITPNEQADLTYFCTPKGASIFGWAGADGIHYCFIRGFGRMVFAVSPANAAPDYVHPLARDFTDFLRLLLACGSVDALEQAWGWDRRQFDAYLAENPPSNEQAEVLAQITDKLGLAPMEDPFSYIKDLQASFPYDKLRYTADFYDPDMNANAQPELPEWKVYFNEGFWTSHCRCRSHPGKEISLCKTFQWEEEHWLIPSAYSCSKGLVMDFLLQVSEEKIREFIEKWELSEDSSVEDHPPERQEQIDADNPLTKEFQATAIVNGTALSWKHGYSCCWNPVFPDNGDTAIRSVMAHYSLDPAHGWIVWRIDFPWKTKRRPQIKTLSVRLSQDESRLSGPHFTVSAPGTKFQFIHPVTGILHTLSVEEISMEETPRDMQEMGQQGMEYPSHFSVMSYTLSPDLPQNAFQILDCARSDTPRQKHVDPAAPTTSSSAVFAIIGGADSPTTLTVSGSGGQHLACSALHFEPTEKVEWRILFLEKTREDIVVEFGVARYR